MEHATLARRYLDAWNERDTSARSALVAAVFAPHARYLDPMQQGAGHQGICTMMGVAQQQFPKHHFELTGTPDAHHDVLRFTWSLLSPDGAVAARGTDIATLGSDGRLAGITCFLDYVA